jgi:hypothetical protein
MHSDSLEVIPTLLATEGQQLAIHAFVDGAIGFAAPEAVRRLHKFRHAEPGIKSCFTRSLARVFRFRRTAPPVPAIYVPGGTCVILKDIPPEIQAKYTVQREEGAALVETQGSPNCLRFANGREVFLRDLPDGMLLEVLSLAETEYAMCEQDLAMHA